MDDTTPRQETIVSTATVPTKSRQAYGTAKTENLRDSGLWRILVPGFVTSCMRRAAGLPAHHSHSTLPALAGSKGRCERASEAGDLDMDRHVPVGGEHHHGGCARLVENLLDTGRELSAVSLAERPRGSSWFIAPSLYDNCGLHEGMYLAVVAKRTRRVEGKTVCPS